MEYVGLHSLPCVPPKDGKPPGVGDVVEEFTCLEEDLSFVLEESDCEP